MIMKDDFDQKGLPEVVQEYIKRLARRVRNRHMRQDVMAELGDHFADALAEAGQGKDREELAKALISEFGEPWVLAKLIKRAKKRCRPMWVKFVIRTCQTVLALLVIFAGYTYWFVSGKPTIRVDYLAKLNEMVRPVADESLNAGPHYLRAGELYVSWSELESRQGEKGVEYSARGRPRRLPARRNIMADFTDQLGRALKPQEREALLKWLHANEPAIEELGLGTAKPYCWFRYSVYPGAEKADWDSLIGDLQSGKTLAGHLMQCPLSMDQLYGLVVDGLVDTQLMHVLHNYNPPRKLLDKLSATLAKAFPSGYPIADIGFESGFQLDMVQRAFTDDGYGEGHLIPFALDNLLASGGGKNLAFTPAESVARAMIHPSRRETVQIIEKWKQMQGLYRSTTPYQDYVAGGPVDTWLMKTIEENPRNLFIRELLPGTQRAVWYSYISKAKHEAAQTVVALLRYKAEQGQFPESLDELEPEYLKAVPQDPFGPGSLSYKRKGDDFVLYSWGLNFEDNGGKHNPDVFRMRNAKGDYVFWPPEAIERD